MCHVTEHTITQSCRMGRGQITQFKSGDLCNTLTKKGQHKHLLHNAQQNQDVNIVWDDI